MPSDDVVLSILIPTRNRHETLPLTLATLRKSSSEQIEFVVCDNSDDAFDATRFSSDARFKFFRPQKVLGMTENWEYCLQRSRGSFRGFIGDDDGVLPSSLDNMVKHLRHCSSEVIVAGFANYEWPKHGDDPHLQLIHYNKQADDLRPKVMKDLGAFRFSNAFPMPYNRAIFSKSIESRVRESNNGAFFNSRVPDINGGAILSTFSRSIESFNEVVFIHGASATSNGDLGKAGNAPLEFSKLSKLPFLEYLGDGIGTSSVLVYIEPVLQAFTLTNKSLQMRVSRIISRVFFSTRNINESTAYCLRTWPAFKTFIKFCAIVALIRHKIFWKIYLTRSTWRPLLFDDCSFYVFSPENIPNVERASEVLEKYIIDRKLNTNLVQTVIHSPKYLLRTIICRIFDRKTNSFN